MILHISYNVPALDVIQKSIVICYKVKLYFHVFLN